MKTFVQWFFILGSALFLSWYLPVALKDNMVTLVELGTIAINFACIAINLMGYAESR
jgi:hypothetical protein